MTLKAYDFVLAQMDKAGWTGAGPKSPLCEYILYLPSGTYLAALTPTCEGYPDVDTYRDHEFHVIAR